MLYFSLTVRNIKHKICKVRYNYECSLNFLRVSKAPEIRERAWNATRKESDKRREERKSRGDKRREELSFFLWTGAINKWRNTKD